MFYSRSSTFRAGFIVDRLGRRNDEATMIALAAAFSHTHSRNAVTVAERVPHPMNRCFAYYYAAVASSLLGSISDARHWGSRSLELAVETGLPFFEACSEVLHGWARVRSGETNGLAELRDGIAKYTSTGAVTPTTQFHALLADALLALGRPEDAIRAVQNGFASIQRGSERFYEAELHRLEAEALLHTAGSSNWHAAEASFTRSIELARDCGSILLQQRAANGFARALIEQGRHAEAERHVREALGRLEARGAQLNEACEARALLRLLSNGR